MCIKLSGKVTKIINLEKYFLIEEILFNNSSCIIFRTKYDSFYIITFNRKKYVKSKNILKLNKNSKYLIICINKYLIFSLNNKINFIYDIEKSESISNKIFINSNANELKFFNKFIILITNDNILRIYPIDNLNNLISYEIISYKINSNWLLIRTISDYMIFNKKLEKLNINLLNQYILEIIEYANFFQVKTNRTCYFYDYSGNLLIFANILNNKTIKSIKEFKINLSIFTINQFNIYSIKTNKFIEFKYNTNNERIISYIEYKNYYKITTNIRENLIYDNKNNKLINFSNISKSKIVYFENFNNLSIICFQKDQYICDIKNNKFYKFIIKKDQSISSINEYKEFLTIEGNSIFLVFSKSQKKIINLDLPVTKNKIYLKCYKDYLILFNNDIDFRMYDRNLNLLNINCNMLNNGIKGIKTSKINNNYLFFIFKNNNLIILDKGNSRVILRRGNNCEGIKTFENYFIIGKELCFLLKNNNFNKLLI